MKKVFNEVNSLDKRCYVKFNLTEDILMENAANRMFDFVKKKIKKKRKILIVAGAGNNGADGIVLARLLYLDYDVKLYLPYGAKSNMAKLQLERASLIGIKITKTYPLKTDNYSLIVDCLFGTGLNRELDEKSQKIIKKLNKMDGYKLACDIPSGIDSKGFINSIAFKANRTITMGALKKSLYSDIAKDYVSKIKVGTLGVSSKIYNTKSDCYLLEKKDLKLPLRDLKDTHKGTFGHLAVIIGEKKGAGKISAKTALKFGVGLVTAITKDINLPNSIMQSEILPLNTTAIAIGMGLGTLEYRSELFDKRLPLIIDADMIYKREILKLLDRDNIVLTPHPKEFCNLLKITNIEDITIEQLQKDRFKYVELFCKKYPNVVLLLKGANVLIGQNKKLYINSFGISALSFGGSGDILSGLVGSLLAQGYSPIDSAIGGSLAHTLSALKYKGANYSLCPNDLIKQIKKL